MRHAFLLVMKKAQFTFLSVSFPTNGRPVLVLSQEEEKVKEEKDDEEEEKETLL